MATDKQKLGEAGEKIVAKNCACPRCKRTKSYKRLPNNFKCADLICDFCGFLAQVKACTVADISKPPDVIRGAAWGPQNERMQAAIYFPLYIVTVNNEKKKHAVFYLSADLQEPQIFQLRNPLSPTAKRAGWRGFNYKISEFRDRLVRIL